MTNTIPGLASQILLSATMSAMIGYFLGRLIEQYESRQKEEEA